MEAPSNHRYRNHDPTKQHFRCVHSLGTHRLAGQEPGSQHSIPQDTHYAPFTQRTEKVAQHTPQTKGPWFSPTHKAIQLLFSIDPLPSWDTWWGNLNHKKKNPCWDHTPPRWQNGTPGSLIVSIFLPSSPFSILHFQVPKVMPQPTFSRNISLQPFCHQRKGEHEST